MPRNRLQNKFTHCKGIRNNTGSRQTAGIQEELDTTCKQNGSRQTTQDNETLFRNWQKESWQTSEETSRYVRPERVNKWPNSMTDIWWWWWCKGKNLTEWNVLNLRSPWAQQTPSWGTLPYRSGAWTYHAARLFSCVAMRGAVIRVTSDSLQWTASLQGGSRAGGNPLWVLRYCVTLLFVRYSCSVPHYKGVWRNRDVAPFIHVPPLILTPGTRCWWVDTVTPSPELMR